VIELLPGQTLGEPLGGELPEVSARDWVEGLFRRLPAAEAFARVEHRFGVLPLLDAFFELRGTIAESAAGSKLGALGLFTPTPELKWCVAAAAGEPAGGGLLLCGEVRIASPIADGSIVLVRLAGEEHRLAWLDHGAPGVERRGSPCWLCLDGVLVGPGLVSRPITLAPDGELYRLLETYAGLWALAAAACAREGVSALRRAARETSFNSSQIVAMAITEVEIEADLAAAAVRRSGGLAVAAAAARALERVASRSAELRAAAGLELAGPFADERLGCALSAYLGGALMLENEVGRLLGIPQEANG